MNRNPSPRTAQYHLDPDVISLGGSSVRIQILSKGVQKASERLCGQAEEYLNCSSIQLASIRRRSTIALVNWLQEENQW